MLIPPGGGPTRHRIRHALRFRAAGGASLSRTNVAAPTNARIFTLSAWIKRGTFATGAFQTIFGGSSSAAQQDTLGFGAGTNGAGDQLLVRDSGTGAYNLLTNALFRDGSAHGHLLVAVDTTQATAANRVRLYWNGVEIASFASASYPAANYAFDWNAASRNWCIGQRFVGAGSMYLDGYLSEIVMVDGQQLAPAAFGRVDVATNAWVPLRYAGVHGANGFHLPFDDAASTATIARDRSGNGNHWTASGIGVVAGLAFDQMLDSPTNNFAVLSGVDNAGANTPSNANLRMTLAADAAINSATIPVASGKWYWEVHPETIASNAMLVGIANAAVAAAQRGGNTANGFFYVSDGTKYANNASAAYGAPYTAANVIGVALDMDARTVTCYRDNVSQGVMFSALPDVVVPTFGNGTGAGGQVFGVNFGQRAFVHTPPAGFVALNAANLPAPTVRRGDDAFHAALRAGTGVAASVASLRFQPDLLWLKSRSNATNHNLFDAARGAQNGLISNGAAAEYADANALGALNANGYSLGADTGARGVNLGANAYVDWAFRRGAAYGFDIATDGGTSANKDIAHALNATPHFMLRKCRNVARSWRVYHRNANANPATGSLILDGVAAFAADATDWNNTLPGPATFRVGVGYNVTGETYVTYLWTSVPGFSLFGGYVGNGSADGPFVWCGFRPRWLMVKGATITTDWYVVDAARAPFNAAASSLYPSRANAEETNAGRGFDLLAGGFKLRQEAGYGANNAGETYVFAAFAETPFKSANAR